MKRIKNRAIAFLAAVLLPLMSVSPGVQAAGTAGDPQTQPASTADGTAVTGEVREGYTKAAQANSRVLYVNKKNGDFYIENTKTGLRWYANPPEGNQDTYAQGVYKMEIVSSLLINVFDIQKKSTFKKNSETACVRKNGVMVTALDNGFQVVYTFADEGIKIPLQLTLSNDSLSVKIAADGIEESKTDQFLLNSVSLLPNFGAGGSQDNGYALIPDGSGAIMNFHNGKSMMDEYEEPVYGRDLAYNMLVEPNQAEKIMLPVFGIKNGAQAFAAIITEGDTASMLHAVPSLKNNTYAQVYDEFVLRSEDKYMLGEDTSTAQTIQLYQTGRYETEACTVRYLFLDGDQADYSGMAKCCQQYFMQKDGLSKNSQTGNRLYLDFYGAVVKKEPFLGIPVNRNKTLSTFEDIGNYLNKLKDDGITGVQTRMLEWSRDGLAGKIETTLSPVSAVGSEKKLQALSRQSGDEQGDLFFGMEVRQYKKGGNGFSTFFDGAKSFSAAPAYQYKFLESTRLRDQNASRYQLLNPLHFGDVAKKLTASVQKKKLTALSPVSIANNIYGSYGKELTTREDTEKAYTSFLETLSGKASLLLDNPAGYALKYTAAAVNVPVSSSGFDVFDESVPFYQLVLSGICPYATEAVNLDVNPADMLLHAAETGSSLHYALITGNSTNLLDTDLNFLYSADASVWEDTITANEQKLGEISEATGGSEFTTHEILASGVSCSTYENGAKILVNYNNTPFDSPFGRIDAHSYLIARG